ncbi:Redoxin [Cylindrobasidium torrendii FP15055 ss-10]|uniref:Redoxin n=1 Tax=Cylindrobasidium torrendii FP15055 ss-10 TaxID=1314674 RepID=A0A0D7BD94_9AGAR|nr:Redoxin [Cylindrobasidium torrendii FP15055 ss-10]
MSGIFGNAKTAATAAAAAAHSTAASLLASAQIAPGTEIPDIKLLKESSPELNAEGAGDAASALKTDGRIIILGVPGAFTTPCSNQVPQYIEAYDEFVAKGVKAIYVVAVNDQFTVKAWKEKLAPNGTPIRFLADDQSAWTSATGLIFDATPLLGGPRSKRYAMIVENGKVSSVFVEDAPPNITVTSAKTLLAHL